MNPVTCQAIAAERISDLHAAADAERRIRLARRPGRVTRSSRVRLTVPSLQALPRRGGTSPRTAAGQP
jgi:hypothetical protein